MPDIAPIIDTFPDKKEKYTWDIKVHMLMPRQYPCIPHWHTDNVPRINGVQQFHMIKPQYPMWAWLSNGPLTQFKHGYLAARAWHKFTQLDEHRGTAASEFGWRCFIRATDQHIQKPKKVDNPFQYIRRHCQVYLDADTYQW